MFKIPFKVGPKKVGIQGKKLRYVARPHCAPKLKEMDIIEQVIRNYGGVNKGEVVGVLDALANEFRNMLFLGHAVKLMGFGTFRISFSSDSYETPEEVTPESIRNARIIFTPDKTLKNDMKKNAVFYKMDL